MSKQSVHSFEVEDANENTYREFYQKKIGVELPKCWHIHHIDHDRSNNQFHNLLALPDFLHSSFHFYKSFYPKSVFFEYAIDGRLNSSSLHRMVDVLDCVQSCVRLEDEIMMGHVREPTSKIYDDLYNEIKGILK